MSFALSSTQLVAAASAGWAFTHFGYPKVLGAIALIATIAAVAFRRIQVVDASPAAHDLAEPAANTSATTRSDVVKAV